jgi:hypothetical protein
LAIVAAVRQAVGDDCDILIEAHDRFSVPTAIRIGHLIEEYRPMWLETPVMSTDIQATLEVARAIKVPVATGERFNRLGMFLELLAGLRAAVRAWKKSQKLADDGLPKCDPALLYGGRKCRDYCEVTPWCRYAAENVEKLAGARNY